MGIISLSQFSFPAWREYNIKGKEKMEVKGKSGMEGVAVAATILCTRRYTGNCRLLSLSGAITQ
jgi:hypothetical protein